MLTYHLANNYAQKIAGKLRSRARRKYRLSARILPTVQPSKTVGIKSVQCEKLQGSARGVEKPF
jgi:hypothetical protein